MTQASIIHDAVTAIARGEVIAYPTEAVYGLGCDPFCEQAVDRIMAIKNRSPAQGLILIAAGIDQILPYIEATPEQLERAAATWPGHHTWIFNASPELPGYLSINSSIAFRVTAHPIAQSLCQGTGRPLVSTSANRRGQPPATTEREVRAIFADEVAVIVPGECDTTLAPSRLTDARSGVCLRQ